MYVYDNGSADTTGEVAAASGAVVRRSPLPGKGNNIRQMLADVNADVYLLVDGDDTYETLPSARISSTWSLRQDMTSCRGAAYLSTGTLTDLVTLSGTSC